MSAVRHALQQCCLQASSTSNPRPNGAFLDMRLDYTPACTSHSRCMPESKHGVKRMYVNCRRLSAVVVFKDGCS